MIRWDGNFFFLFLNNLGPSCIYSNSPGVKGKGQKMHSNNTYPSFLTILRKQSNMPE